MAKKTQTSKSTRQYKTARKPQLLALEPRVLFDGAALATAIESQAQVQEQAQSVDTTATATEANTSAEFAAATAAAPNASDTPLTIDSNSLDAVKSLSGSTDADLVGLAPQLSQANTVVDLATPSDLVAEAGQIVSQKLVDMLQTETWQTELFNLFGGQNEQMTAEWVAAANAFRDQVLAGTAKVQVELRQGADIMGINGAFAAVGPKDQPIIYLNATRLSGGDLSFATGVLAEEIGHWIDSQINGKTDTTGDEGEMFAATLLDYQVTQDQALRISTENDFINLTIDGQQTQVEMASLLFSGQSYYAGLTAANGTTGQAGQTALLESNQLVLGNALQGSRTLFVSDPETATSYSGNNVRGYLYEIDSNNNVLNRYYGEFSRLYKVGSTAVAAQFYVYNDPTQPGITNTAAETIFIDFFSATPNFSKGQSVGTSSDPIASALNAMLPTSQPALANADTATALEAGGVSNTTLGTTATGNIITNDAGGVSGPTYSIVDGKLVTSSTSLKLTSVSSVTTGSTNVTSAGSVTYDSVVYNAAVVGQYGTLYVKADGTYKYVVDNNNATVQALRTTSNTLSETFKYNIAAGSTVATSTLTITVQGANDNPIAVNDYNVAKAPVSPSTVNWATETIGYKATGNVLPNDTDLDAGDTKTVGGIYGSASVTTNGPTVLSFSALNSSVSVGDYAFLDGTTKTPLRDAAGNQIKIASIDTVNKTFTLSGQVANATLASGTVLGFSMKADASSGYKITTMSSSSPAAATTMSISAASGTIAVGMSLLGTGLATDPKVTAINYDSNGNITGVTLDQSVALNGQTLTFRALAGSTITGRYGTLNLASNGGYTYTPTVNPGANVTVVDSFNYTMYDTAAASSNATLYITLVGSGPTDPIVAANTAVAVEAGGVSNGTAGTDPAATSTSSTPDTTSGLLTNDTQNGGTQFIVSTIKSIQASTETTVSGSVTYGDVTYNTSVAGQYGTLYIKSDGTYKYVVDNNNPTVQAMLASNTLTDTYQYKVSNGSGINYSTLTVTITGADDAPVATNDSNLAIANYSNPTGNVLPNDTDVDSGDTKTVSKVIAGTNTPTTAVSTGTTVSGAYGTLTINSDGTYTYVVDTNNATVIALSSTQTVNDVFTYQMDDAGGLTSKATLTLVVQGSNEAPVNTLPASISVNAGSSLSLNSVSAFDVDDNLASVTISVVNGTLHMTELSSTGSAETLETTLTGGAVIYGSTSGSPNGTSSITLYGTKDQINAALSTLIYTPNSGYSGTDTFTMTSLDAEGLKDVDTMSIAVSAPALTVSSISVNEGSPYGVFSVGGVAGQTVTLGLSSGSGTVGTDTSNTLQYFNGASWVDYDGTAIIMPSTGTLLVRAAITNDTLSDNNETVTLTATNAVGTATTGTATIYDDGTGGYFAADNNTATPAVPTGITLDDDRPLTVSNVTVNEGSPYAVFTVTGATGQTVNLSLTNATGTPSTDPTGGTAALGSTLPALEYFNTSTNQWATYNASTPPTILSGTTLLVRVAISAEQDAAPDGPETFNLVATNTGGTAGTGVGVIVDDGTGSYWIGDATTAATASQLTTAGISLDDDRVLHINNITVNESSPYATFTVSGAAGQLVTLSLESTSSATGNGTDYGNSTSATDSDLQYWTGSTWATYTTGTKVALDANGELLVRTAIINDGSPDNNETFRLQATNTGGSSTTTTEGIATIKDDGTGDVFKYSSDSSATPLLPSDPSYPVLDDDRALSVSNVTVNEGSPYAVFTVTGATGQTVQLSLSGATTGTSGDPTGGSAMLGASLPALEYFENGTWKTYDANNPPEIAAGSTTLLVRVAISAEQEAALDGPETFNLVATNTGGTNSLLTQGLATITDNGSGSYFAADNNTATSAIPTGVVLDDDRPVTVTSPTVNEASPYAVFTIDGEPNQLVSLTLAAGTATAGVDYTSKLEYSTDGGQNWTLYTGGTIALTGTNGTALVRTPIVNDSIADNGEQFTLTATNTGGTAVVGTATIQDDGNGTIFNDNGTENAAAVKDDDRPLRIAPVTVNEGSPYAVFTVSGVANQLAALSLSNVDTTGLSSLQYFNGTNWLPYTSGNVPLDNSGLLLVRVALSPEQEKTLDGPETFNLVATNTGGTAATGVGTIFDDGTGSYFAETNNTATSSLPAGVLLDDDRPLSVTSVTVNEGSPYAVFTVTGATGQTVLLSLVDHSVDATLAASLKGDFDNNANTPITLPELEYFEGGVWKTYNASNPPEIAAGATTLLVRVAISAEQEVTLDGPETFNLVATNTGGTAATGVGTINDDGTGSYFAANNNTATSSVPAGVLLDDDRILSISSPTVNEGSDWAVFNVGGVAGQKVTLSLTEGNPGEADLDQSQPLEYWDGRAWVDYVAGSQVTIPAGGVLLVRVDIRAEQDAPYEGAERFQLVATNQSGQSAEGTGTIVDDGKGVIYPDVTPTNASTPVTSTTGLEDDRELAVSSPTVNEGSDWAVFNVGGVAGQKVTLSLTEGNPGEANLDQSQPLQYWDGSDWMDYIAGSQVTIPAGGVLLVRVDIRAEQDAPYEGAELFQLVATNLSGQSAEGTGTIVDDGTGVIYPDVPPTNASTPMTTATGLEDDRAKPVTEVLPPAIPKPVFVAPAYFENKQVEQTKFQPAQYEFHQVVLDFNGVQGGASQFRAPGSDTAGARAALESAARSPYSAYDRVGDEVAIAKRNVELALSSPSDRDMGLKNTLMPPVANAKPGSSMAYKLPAGTFTGGKGDLQLVAVLKDGKPLPAWLKFDPKTGRFIGEVPHDHDVPLDIRVIATDAKGDQAEAKVSIQPEAKKVGLKGKAPFTAQLRNALRLRA